MCQIGWVGGWEGRLPGERTARHSSSVFWTGWLMVVRVEEEKSEPRKGIVGMEYLRALGRRADAGVCGRGKRRAVVLLRA